MNGALRNQCVSFFASVARIFAPPFSGLPLIMGCYFVFSYIALPHNPIWQGDLPDPDDYTYLTQTLDWLQGQSWFDNIQHRMSPPEGVAIHYTRFAELPIAATILLFRLFHYSWHGAALLASFLLPIIYLGALFTALRFAASQFIAPQWARLTSFVVMFASALLFKFAPGQVDHHGLEAILTITAVGLVAQMFARPDLMRWATAAGIMFSLTTAIALETVPWLVLASTAIGLWATIQGPRAIRATNAFAITLFLSSVILLFLDKPATNVFQADILAYSITYVELTAGIAAALLWASTLSYLDKFKLRLALSGLIAAILAVMYLSHFPALLAGPYGAMDKKLSALFFANLDEAVALIDRRSFYGCFLRLAPALLGLTASITFFRRANGSVKYSWGLLVALLATSIALTAFYQSRVLIYASLFSVIPLTALVARGWPWLASHAQDRKRFWAEIALILSVGPLTSIFLPAVQDGRSFNTGMLLFPAQTFSDTCQMRGLEQILNDPYFTDRKPLRLINMIDQGPELLFRTPHAVMSAPYHTNVRGNLDALELFTTTNSAAAEQIVQRDGINLIALCRDIPDMYLDGGAAHYVMLPTGGKQMQPNASFAGQLAFHQIPDWLTEIQVPTPSNYLLFEVKNDR
jgi:hypothetical protein